MILTPKPNLADPAFDSLSEHAAEEAFDGDFAADDVFEEMAPITLELTPDQAKIMTVAQQMADRLTLALRSVADAQDNDTLSADYLLNGGAGQPEIQVIKSGSIVKGGQGASQ